MFFKKGDCVLFSSSDQNLINEIAEINSDYKYYESSIVTNDGLAGGMWGYDIIDHIGEHWFATCYQLKSIPDNIDVLSWDRIEYICQWKPIST